MLVNAVHRVPPERIVGAPKWYDTQFFDIEGRGKWEERPTDATYREIIQQVLVERFRLKAHIEQRPMEVYALVLARGGKLGPGLRRASDECVKRSAAKKEIPLPKFPAPGQRPDCGISARMHEGVRQLRLGSVRIVTILSQTRASGSMGRLVVDRTGLEGLFDVDLDYVPDSTDALSPEQARSVPNGPSLTTALRDQLGLRFERRKEPVEVLVIDHVEMPSPN